MMQCWRLDTQEQTLVLGAVNQKLPSVVYWGANLPENEDLELLINANRIDLTGGMLDENPDLSICPEASNSFPGQAGLVVRSQTGEILLPKFRFDSQNVSTKQIELTYTNEDNSLVYVAKFIAFHDSNMIQASSVLRAKNKVRLDWLAAPVIPAPQAATHMIDYAGRWCGEFQEVKTPWNFGIRCRNNRTGRTGHEHFPALVLPLQHTSYSQGDCYAFHYAWSGGHKMIAEELADGRRQIQFGHAERTELEPANSFQSAPLYLTFSSQGRNGCAKAFQRHLRNNIVEFSPQNTQRQVHYNCWEAVYFNHNLPELKKIATMAAKLGAERFVLDDGWFGTRDDDTRALAEWQVDACKYPDGLHPLVDHVKALGMSFGIWFEPEMINPRSYIYDKNPDWIMGAQDQILGRNQMVLNIALPEVQDYIFDCIAKIMREYSVDYIKWDHNRVLPTPDASQTRASYELFDRVKNAFPHLEIESCASGGGRIDFGILSRTSRVWLSDSNDVIERARIQHGAAQFIPASVTGSHVGPRVCHTSGRSLDIRFRAWIAAQRHMGFEMDPRELTEQEASVLKQVTQWWKNERNWLMRADILRLDSLDPAVIAEQHMSEDGEQFIVFANKIDSSKQISPRPLRLSSLNPGDNYKVELVNRSEVHKLSRGNPAIKFDNLCLSGQYLMTHGITLPWSFPNQCWVVRGVRQ